MTIKILIDSACDLPEEVARRLDITVVPLFIQVGGESYRDGVDLSREDFYRRLPDWPSSPTTAAPGPELFRREYELLAAAGADEILSIHLSKSLSLVVESARQAAAETDAARVTVYDSGQLSLGAGFLALTAAEAADRGASMAEIVALLDDQAKRTYTFAALDTLEYLNRSGRMNGIMSVIGNLFQIKPLLRMHLGKPTSEKIRTRGRAVKRLLEILNSLGPLERAALLHSAAAPRAEALLGMANGSLPKNNLLRGEISPVLGAHIGPGVVGFVCITKK
jgi:DegV family protein with EDD domain